jgi:lipopolysaccharide assembly outer membrane protein LptD (OstA)
VLAALAACARPAHAPAPATSASPRPSLTLAGSARPTATAVPVYISGAGNANQPTVLTETIGGRRVYTIRALAFRGDVGTGGGSGIATLEQPHITFVDRSGTTTIADAPKATVTQRDKSVLMTGGVHARTSDGSNLTCDTLRYDGATEHFFGTGHVVMTGTSGLALTGNYLTGDVRLRNVQVTKVRPW